MNDNRVPTWIKIVIPLVVLIYFIMPADLIPDNIPVLGQLDDIGVLLLGMSLIIRLSPQYVVDEHREALGYYTPAATATAPASNGKGQAQTDRGTIDGEYKIVRPRG